MDGVRNPGRWLLGPTWAAAVANCLPWHERLEMPKYRHNFNCQRKSSQNSNIRMGHLPYEVRTGAKKMQICISRVKLGKNLTGT
jgi:hypothetical protein